MGKDTRWILWFISETIYQSYFCRTTCAAIKQKESQDSCIHSSIYNLFIRCLGFIFSTAAFCRMERKTAMSAVWIHILLVRSSSFFLSLFLPSIPVLIFFSWLTGWCSKKRANTPTLIPAPTPHPHTHKHTHWPRSSKLSCLNGVDFSPRCQDNKTGEGESPARQKSLWETDLVAHFTLFVLSP